MHHLEVSPFTRILMDQVQIVALLFMATMYVLKVRWLLSYPAAKERTPPRGDHDKAIRYAYLTLAMPWELESTRRQWPRYLEFVFFHLGAAVCILSTFILPYWPQVLAGKGTMALLNFWLVTAFFAVGQQSEAWLVAFFGTTTFFLIYVPFSKISHYLLWPFIRYYQGKHFGHRGVYPKKMVANNGLRQTQVA